MPTFVCDVVDLCGIISLICMRSGKKMWDDGCFVVAVCRMPQVEDASAAKLEELRLGAVSQGREWLRISLEEMRQQELRVLATAAGVQIRPGSVWLPVLLRKRQSLVVHLCAMF